MCAANKVRIRWAPRVKPGRVRRLYELNRMGIYDEDLLAQVGWGLHARCRDALTVHRAMRGELPCPACGATVVRPRRRARRRPGRRPRAEFACPHCEATLSWAACKDALRNRPRCFDCGRPLRWSYAANDLTCSPCGEEWTWQRYRRSVRNRVYLPCPECGRKVRRPKRQTGPRPEAPSPEQIECPKCGGSAVHAEGKLSCPACGYEVKWAAYRRRLKRRAEPLRCGSCGYSFTYGAWKRSYRGDLLLTGNPAPLRAFVDAWPRCRTPQRQMICIDRLLHAVHARGPLGPVLIRGTQAGVGALLDDLAAAR
jgi:predicted RNA-binding Zn-ribbon protein involved in translation (DUF1610 family)